MKKMQARHRFAALLLLSLIPRFAMATHWSYEGEEAPEHWSEISPENIQCKQGMNQSPIDINTALNAHIHPLALSYSDGPVNILNNGHTIQASFAADAQDTINLDGIPFTLQQFHFHTPSENTIHGRHYALEMHLVHKNSDGEIAVVAVMFETGKANNVIAQLWQSMPPKAEASTPLLQNININDLLPHDKTYYRFSGSLTTPPCSEGVIWLVLKHPLTISQQQLQAFINVMHHSNNRPVQPLHGRLVIE